MVKELINDDRLTPTMERVRSGSVQLFREADKNNRSFINSENCDVSLEHERREMYAELIDSKWYWVSGCAECNGKERDWMSYIECDEHNRCVRCRKKRKEFEGAVWGGKRGWTCKPCMEVLEAEKRAEAFEKFNASNMTDLDFRLNDEIICPHCGSEINKEDVYADQELECGVCHGRVEVEVHHEISYSTTIIGKRITK